MKIIKRKLIESLSMFYRFWVWPWIRAYIEISTKSIMKQGSYIKNTELEGYDFIGKRATLMNCTMGCYSVVQFGGDFTDTDIGRYSQLGPNINIIIGNHPTSKFVSINPAFYNPDAIFGYTFVKERKFVDTPDKRTVIGSDVWIGNNVNILGGVTIGDGAVIGAGALVINDIPPFSVNVGIPAKTIKYRFTEEQIEKLLADKWWEKDEEWIKANIDLFSDIEEYMK